MTNLWGLFFFLFIVYFSSTGFHCTRNKHYFNQSCAWALTATETKTDPDISYHKYLLKTSVKCVVELSCVKNISWKIQNLRVLGWCLMVLWVVINLKNLTNEVVIHVRLNTSWLKEVGIFWCVILFPALALNYFFAKISLISDRISNWTCHH